MQTLTDCLRQRVRDALAAGTQRDLAARAGVSQAQLCRFASGKRGLTLHTAERLCKAFGLKLQGAT